MSRFSPPTAADRAAAVAFGSNADFADLQESCFVTENGCKVVDLRHVVVGQDLGTFEREKNVGQMIFVLQGLIVAHPQAPEPPVLQDHYDSARATGGDGAQQAQVAARLMIQATMEFLYKREDRGGLRHVPGKFLFLPSAFPAKAPAPAPVPSATPSGASGPLPAASQQDDSSGSKKRGVEDLTSAMDSTLPEERDSKRPAGNAASSEQGHKAEGAALFEMSATDQVR